MFYLSISAFVLLWLVFWFRLRGKVYEMDPAGHKFMFAVVWAPYRFTYWTIFILSLVGAFKFGELHVPMLGGMFLISTVSSLIFNLWVTLAYESYIASRYTMTGSMQSNYTASRYAFTLALGTYGVFFFVAALILAFFTVTGF
jgi:hypothetical protein